jgi:DNA-directed RNA polymerase subunit RPC12/RpoP
MPNKLSDGMRMDLPCLTCGQVDKQFIREMMANERIACRYCNNIIDISSMEWRARINDAAEQFDKLTFPRAKPD